MPFENIFSSNSRVSVHYHIQTEGGGGGGGGGGGVLVQLQFTCEAAISRLQSPETAKEKNHDRLSRVYQIL